MKILNILLFWDLRTSCNFALGPCKSSQKPPTVILALLGLSKDFQTVSGVF